MTFKEIKDKKNAVREKAKGRLADIIAVIQDGKMGGDPELEERVLKEISDLYYSWGFYEGTIAMMGECSVNEVSGEW